MTIEFDDMYIEPHGAPTSPQRRGRRAVTVVAAVMLVAIAGGIGFGIGREVASDAAEGAAGGEISTADVVASAAAEPVPDEGGPPSSAVEPVSEPAVDGGTASVRAGSEGSSFTPFGGQPMATLYERVTADGWTLRVQQGAMWPSPVHGDWGVPGWHPAPWCYENGQLRVAIAGNGVIDVGGVGWFAEPYQGRAVSWLLLGANDDVPRWVVVVQTPPEVTSVRADFGDGTIDRTEPQNGIAVLTAPGETPAPLGSATLPGRPRFTVSLEGGAAPIELTSDDVGAGDEAEYRAACMPPPPALPAPGEQPADVATADAEIRSTMTAIYTAIGTGEEAAAMIDDPTGIAEARERVEAGGFAEAAAAAEVTIEELVFTSPDEAWFRYRIETTTGTFGDRYGIAVARDDGWRITRSTVCQDLSLAGGDCGPGWEPIVPPGANVNSGPTSPTPIPLGD